MFYSCMKSYNTTRASWVDFFPTQDLIQGADPDAPLIVDIGGNQGIDLERFRSKHAANLTAGTLVLQDLPAVFANATYHSDIKPMSHDFFQPQPVEGEPEY